MRVIGPNGEILRLVSIPTESLDRTARSVVRNVSALGWQADEKRVFAILDFGLEDRALVSYAVGASDDYWETSLPNLGDDWPFGFVLEPVKKRKH